ncbi:hypothetical protein V6N13_131722 [Hibiscus sabdariffa]
MDPGIIRQESAWITFVASRRKVSVEFLVPLLTIFCVHQSSLVTDLFIFEVTLLTKEYHHFHLFLISSLGS